MWKKLYPSTTWMIFGGSKATFECLCRNIAHFQQLQPGWIGGREFISIDKRFYYPLIFSNLRQHSHHIWHMQCHWVFSYQMTHKDQLHVLPIRLDAHFTQAIRCPHGTHTVSAISPSSMHILHSSIKKI